MRKPLTSLTNSQGLGGRPALDDTGTSRRAALRAPDSEAEKRFCMQIGTSWT